MHGWAPEVIGAVGRPEANPNGYLEVFFAPSASSQQAGEEALKRMFARQEQRDRAQGNSGAHYDAVCTWGIPDHSLLQR